MIASNIAWAIPAFLFVIVVVTIRVRPVIAALVFVGAPFIATVVQLLGLLLVNQLTGQIGVPHLRDLIAFGYTFYIFSFPQALYPHGALLGAVVLVTYAWLERSNSLPPLPGGRRLGSGVLIGVAVGGLFAALVMLLILLTRENADFIGFITGGTLDRLDFGTELLVSVCTGAADGALIAIFGVKSPRRDQIDGAIAGATI